MKYKLKDILLVIIFFSILLITFFVNIITEDELISVSERRKLASFPKIDTVFNGDYTQKFESYATDQFKYRDEFRKIKENVEFNLFLKKDNNDLYIKNGKIYKNIGILNENEVKKAASKFNKVYDKYLNKNESKLNNVYYSIIPDKSYYLENNALKLDVKRMEEILDESLYYNFRYIDIKDLLDKDSYYDTDIHWKQENLLGVVQKINSEMERETIINNYQMLSKGKFKGGYSGQLITSDELFDYLKYISTDEIENAITYNYETQKESKVYDISKWEKSNDKYDFYLSGPVNIMEIRNKTSDFTNYEKNKNLVIFRDSFASSLVPLLIGNYEKITLVDLRYISTDYVGNFVSFEDSDVLFLYSDLVINSSTMLK